MSAVHLAKAAVETARISVPTLFEAVLGIVSPATCDQRLDSWSRNLLKEAEIDLIVVGTDPPDNEAFVIMSNHQSLYDIPVLFQALRRRIRMVTKTELFRIPIWGRAMHASGFVEVDRSNRERAKESLRLAREAMHKGTDIWIAPEGTRSDTGELGPFKKGGFHLAVDAGARILPVSISGTRDTLPARGRHVTRGARVRVTLHAPIDPATYGPDVSDALIEAVRSTIASGL
jgi:1-acyl-sn-glycerol-3-phosphate acyltransferase